MVLFVFMKCANFLSSGVSKAIDIMNLSNWSLSEEFDMENKEAGCIAWNSSPFDAPMIAVGSGKSLRVYLFLFLLMMQIWQYFDKSRKWQVVLDLLGHEDSVHDVAWAPNMGRSFALIASACKDNFVRIFKVVLNATTGKFDYTLVSSLNSHSAEVWRVEWNMIGTILASSGDDGTVRLYKADFSGQWSNYCAIAGDRKIPNELKD